MNTVTKQVLAKPEAVINGELMTMEAQQPIFGLRFLKRVHEMALGKFAETALDYPQREHPVLLEIEFIGSEIKRIERDGSSTILNNQTILESVILLSNML